MKLFETVVKILGSAWGVWSIAAFSFGIFFWITSALIKKAKITTLSRGQSYRFFRLAMVLAFVLALATLVTGTVRDSSTRHPARRSRGKNASRNSRET